MKHSAKRVLSIVLCLLMMLSMLTAIVLPAAAEETSAPDAYAKITGTVDGNVIIPDANVYFIDPAWAASAPAASGETFEYTYGDGEVWGNGKTYLLTWGVNTGTSIGNIKSLSKTYNAAWSVGEAPLVMVCAPGNYGYVNDYDLVAAGSAANPTAEQLMGFYLLGPQAGKSAVSSDKSTKEKAKEIQNDRSDDLTTEAVFTSTFWLPGHCDMHIDGFAVNGAARLYAYYSYVNYYFSNLYFVNQTAPASNSIFSIGGGTRATTVEMHDCYFNMNLKMTNATLTGEENDLIGNKIIIDNCVFAEGKLSASAPTANWQTHHIKMWPNTAATATAAAGFFGEYATKPLIQITNCVGVDWESAHLFRFPLNASNYSGYNDNAVMINIKNNKFYDMGTANTNSDIFYIDAVTQEDQANSFTFNMTDNLFSFSDEVFDQDKTGTSYVINFGAPANFSCYKINMKENIFVAPNNLKCPHVSNQNNKNLALDMSGNLFMDNQGNIMPLLINNGSPPDYINGWNVQSDIYASDEMKGGIRELMTVKDIENGSVLFSYVQLRRRSNYANFDYLTGALTVMLKNGITYDADTLVKFSDPNVKYLGLYTEEACTNKVETVTQDTITGKYAKAQYKAGNTTLTVVYLVNTPRVYLFVDPTGTYKTNGYTFNGKVYKDGAVTDGIYAKFYTNFDNGNGNDNSAYAATTNPNLNDLLAVTTSTYTDQGGRVQHYDNNLWSVVIFCPGTHEFATSSKAQGMGKSVAILGPQWGVSPYGEANKEGKLANGRSFDPTQEAVVKGTIQPSGDSSLHYVVDGVAFAGNVAAYSFAGNSKQVGSMYQNHIIRNCVFSNDTATVIAGASAANGNKVNHVTIEDCAYDGTGLDRSASNSALLNFRANFTTIKNFAVMNENSKNNRLAYVTVTDGSMLRWNAKRTYFDVDNVINYNTNRDGFLYTLRESDGTTLNATKEFYPAGLEMNLTNTYTYGGTGYLWGIQGNETADKLVKLTATDNYFYRPNWDSNVIAHYQRTNHELNVYTDDSVIKDNVFITKNAFKANAYASAVNIDDNFFGKVEGDKVVATYVDSAAAGVSKDLTTYWLDEAKTTKNTALGLVDNGYKSIELGEFKGYNQYAIDATNITAAPSIFKAVNGATIEGVYTDETCTTAATAFTHPQDVYVKVTKGDLTLVNKVTLNCVCSHDGTTYEDVIEEPTCTVPGSKGNLCEYCDEQIGESIPIPATGIHTLGDVIEDVAPTCTTAGVGHKDCSVCQQTIESNIPISEVADAHVWKTAYETDEEPSCTKRGSESIHCALCGVQKAGSNREIPMIDHAWETDYTIDDEASCQANGSKSIHCSSCGVKKDGSTVVIPMGQHVWNDFYTVDVPSTCNFSGMESIHCALCGSVQVGSARDLPLSDHNWDTVYTIDKPATCAEEGAKSFHCVDCYAINEESVVAIAKTEHEWMEYPMIDWDADCFNDGQMSYHCFNCDASKDPEVIPADHFAVETVYIVIPTYQKGGIEGNICMICGTVLEQWAVDAIEGVMADTAFEDVDSNDWFYKNDAVNFVYNQGLMNGTTKTTFAPDATLTRGMFVTILGRLAGVNGNGNGKTAFKDVDANAYYAPYIKWASDEGIVNGYSATEFRPDGNITREQICKMILEFCNSEGITVEQVEKAITFKDASEISGYAKKYVKVCQMAGLVNGEKSGSGYIFRPQDTASRAEAATIIRNFCYAYMIQ